MTKNKARELLQGRRGADVYDLLVLDAKSQLFELSMSLDVCCIGLICRYLR